MGELISNGALIPALLLAALAGLVSFASPCVLPLAPGYISYVTGLTGFELGEPTRKRRRVLLGSSLFVLGFSAVFVSYGLAFGGLGSFLLQYQILIERILGGLVIVMGLAFLGLMPTSQRAWRVHRTPTLGLAGAPLLGVVFGLGWTPCMGPTLAVVQSLAFIEGSATRGAALSLAYSLGLGLPFIALALGFSRLAGTLSWMRRHSMWITRTGGILLIVVGILLITGLWTELTIWLRVTIPGYTAPI
ncbi:MAG: cytochrome c biogenesis protein CcdA [Candidatus Nanopelagicales bacterium]|nr:cytochrome c biogenesis protein CcdA [Candidatus Nanopelagicales bacterium]